MRMHDRCRRGLLILLCGVAIMSAPSPASAGPSLLGSEDRAAIAAIIGQQVDAFRRDDADEAFGYATPELRAMFGTPERFMRMVREGYAPVYRPRSLDFGDLVENDGIIAQRLSVVGPDGRPVVAVYVMQRQPDGSWRIAGCYLLPTEAETAALRLGVFASSMSWESSSSISRAASSG